MFGGLAKHVEQLDRLERIPEVVSRAFGIALSGRPGPVVVALPQDVLFATGVCPDAPPVRVAQPAPDPVCMAALHTLLARAERPLVIVGGTGWDAAACAALARFVAANDLPVAASFRRQDRFDNRDRHYVGALGFGVSPRLAERVRGADLLLVIGARLGEVASSGYTLLESPQPRQTLIHVHPDPCELGRVYRATLPINAGMPGVAAALAELAPVAGPRWHDWMRQARADFEAHSSPPPADPAMSGVDLAQVMRWLDESLPDDPIVTNGAGNYAVWVHRFFRYRRPATQLAPTNGAMGYGLPAAIAAKLRHPDRPVVCFAGDGCFMMYPQELATAVQYGAAVVVVVVNNGMLGTIRMHQAREFPGRPMATDLRNPDFVALARAFGAHAERVDKSDDFPAAFARASAAGVPALIELWVDPRQVTVHARPCRHQA
jgi:acetolactate synthase-1/2/3 large subunit